MSKSVTVYTIKFEHRGVNYTLESASLAQLFISHNQVRCNRLDSNEVSDAWSDERIYDFFTKEDTLDGFSFAIVTKVVK